MKTRVQNQSAQSAQPVRLDPGKADGESHYVKSTALFFFRGLRTVIDAASELPDLVTQAGRDIGDAWEESNTSPKQ